MTTETAPNSNGNENLEERLKSWERERRGIIADLQKERDERHSLEKKLGEFEKALASAGDEPEDKNNQDKVNRLAQDPDAYIQAHVARALEEKVAPLQNSLENMAKERRFERAYQWLAKQTKKDVDDIYGSEFEQEIVRITKEHSMGMMDPVEGVRAAYKIYQTEQRDKEEAESRRTAAISENATQTGRTSVSTGVRKFTAAEIKAMPMDQYMKNREAIQEAQRNGLITQ